MTAKEQLLKNSSNSFVASSSSSNSSKKSLTENTKTLSVHNNNTTLLRKADTKSSSNTKILNTNTTNTNVELKENFSRQQQLTTTTPPQSPNLLLDKSSNQMIIEKNESLKRTEETNENKKTNDLVILVEKSSICVKKANLESGEISIDINSNLIESNINSDSGDGGGDLIKDVKENADNVLASRPLNDEYILLETSITNKTNATTNNPKVADDEDMPLMSVCQTPPQSAASSMSLANENPFLLSVSHTSFPSASSASMSIKNVTDETLKATSKSPTPNRITDLSAFKAQLKAEQECLKEKLKNSYQRLRSNQTKYFQSHIRRQLKNIKDTKTPQIDDKSIDLLNSVLTSNQAPLTKATTTASILDDIQYEILKQNEDKANKRANYLKELNLNVSKSLKRTKQPFDQHQDNESDRTESECSSDESDEDILIDTDKSPLSSNSKTENTNASNYWLMRRVQLGSEWQRVQLKMKMLKLKNRQCDDYINSHNSLIQTFNAKLVKSNKLIEKLESCPLSNEMPTEKDAIAALSSELQECVAVINKPNSLTSQQALHLTNNSRCSTNSIESRNTNLFNLAKSDMISFDDDDLCKTLKYSLIYFRDNLFKTTCLCDSRKPRVDGMKRKKNFMIEPSSSFYAKNGKTCIFCHLFKTYENNRNLINATTSYSTSDTTTTRTTDAISCELDQSPPPNLVNILNEHSYCKQPKVNKVPINKKSKADVKLLKSETATKLVDFDDGLLLDKVVNERLNRLFESKKNSYKTLFDDDYELDVKQDQMIEAGFDLSPRDIKKLPNLSYEELKFLSDGLDSCSSSNEFDTNNKMSNETMPNIIEIEYDGNPSDLIVNFEELENDPNRFQMVIENEPWAVPSKFIETESKQKQKRISSSSFSSSNEHKNPIGGYDPNIFKQLRYIKSPTKFRRREARSKKTKTKIPNVASTLKQVVSTSRKRNRSSSSSFSSTRSSKSNISRSSSNFTSNSETNLNIRTSHAPSKAAHKLSYYYKSNHANKFDINNIVIPYEMMNNSISGVKAQNVATPKWRLESSSSSFTTLEDIEIDTDVECLNEEEFVKRHEIYELKERYATLYKKLEKEKQEKIKLQQHSTNLIENVSNTNNNNNNSDEINKSNKNPDLEQFKKLVHIIESNEMDKRALQQVSQLSASLPASILSLYMNGNSSKKKKAVTMTMTKTSAKSWKKSKQTSFRDENNNFLYEEQPSNEHELASSMPTSILQKVIKNGSLINSTAKLSVNHWPPRKFPLSDKEYEKMLKEDLHNDQYTHKNNQPLRSFTFATTKQNKDHNHHISTLHTSTSSDQIDALMQIES